MTRSFLLRFQEKCEESCLIPAVSGAETTTKVISEHVAAAQEKSTSLPFISTCICAGTVTNTRIRSEQGDTDFSSAVRTLPIIPIMGTLTKTAVRAESDDQDRRQHEITVLPKCFS